MDYGYNPQNQKFVYCVRKSKKFYVPPNSILRHDIEQNEQPKIFDI